ncbi:MAG: extracellular solute-binding protein [bacterium]
MVAPIKMWVWPAGRGGRGKQFIDSEIRVFKKEWPVEVQLEVIPWLEYWDKIKNLGKEEGGPDILQIGSTWNATLANSGALYDLTETVIDLMGGEIFIPAAWSSCHFPGSTRVSSLPWFVDIRVIYYRSDILSHAGVPRQDLEAWKPFESACVKLKDTEFNGKVIEVLGVSGQKETILIHNIAPWIWGAGGDFLSPDGTKAAFNNEASLRGIEYYIGLVSKGYISSKALSKGTEDISKGFFIDGDYAMSIPGSLGAPSPLDPNNPDYVPEVGENCVASLFPAGPAGRFVFCGGSNLAINPKSMRIAESIELIKFLLSYESQTRCVRALNMLPSLMEPFDAIFMADEPRFRSLKNSWRFGRAFPNVPAWGEIERLLMECFGKIFARLQKGNYDFSVVKVDLDKTAEEVDAILAKE